MNLLQPDKQWIEEADAALRKTSPTVAEVVEATRSFAVLGREGVLTARLADGTQWRIEGQDVRQLTADEIAERVRLHESFE
ncbi:hypothetical protein WL80_28810 [Burkholderia ubonensis]|uniref:hypothetical protein n=1 Tax=Burkholderia ubonensis TaxID=101571 RepID=UPI0007553D48|nr:hypothetical protein [Burkholderia ubonensis]KVC70845.1 hypothetical protein WI75_26265 [Burkholderia ubonensis]KVL63043.1 hypothetical protein WJ48_24010 [Burkholderia ubonensis]KVL76922.1 hypothetical protein WJ49_11260 [Burkholderia ubonensis]KVL91662.1 hypothetical protein WJ50_00445 [Burkholderia ubonensis]KWF02148.1 hypothetical protein WL80_28810 [Burkholderia ubonensis]